MVRMQLARVEFSTPAKRIKGVEQHTFSDKFYDEEFFQMHRDELETRVSAFAQSPAYERIVSSGYLSALRYYDTYLYVGRSGKQESVQHFYMRLAGFCASTTCLYAGLRAALQRARPEIESDMEVFDIPHRRICQRRPPDIRLLCVAVPRRCAPLCRSDL